MQIANFVPICKKHGRHRQFFFLVGQFLKSSLKPFGQIKQHFTGIIWKVLYKISPFYPDWTKTWSSWAIPVSDWLKFKKKSPPLKLGGRMNCYFV
jgi:hypothetical protein